MQQTPSEHPEYRMMLVGSDGRVLMVSPLSASSDPEGVAMARAASEHLQSEGASVDLWDGMRFVEQVKAPRAAL